MFDEISSRLKPLWRLFENFKGVRNGSTDSLRKGLAFKKKKKKFRSFGFLLCLDTKDKVV